MYAPKVIFSSKNKDTCLFNTERDSTHSNSKTLKWMALRSFVTQICQKGLKHHLWMPPMVICSIKNVKESNYRGLCPKEICLKGIRLKGRYLKTVCLKRIMPQDCMPSRDYASRLFAQKGYAL